MLIDTNLISDYSIAQLRELKRIAREELEKRLRIEQVKQERSRHSANAHGGLCESGSSGIGESMSIKITSSTIDESGRCRRWTRTLAAMKRKSGWHKEPTTDAEIVQYVEKRLPAMFYGCLVTVNDGGPESYGVVDPDTKRFEWDKVRA